MNTTDSPLASVLILTYNQAHLVEETLRSVLAQRTTFPFEIVIGDDASKDDTASVCETIGAGFPRLRVLRRPVNLGLIGNFRATLEQCRGRYVALLGGDDIWTDSTKLERQVTFLRDNPGYVLSHTHNDQLDHATGLVSTKKAKVRWGDAFRRMLTGGNFITASTAVFDTQALRQEDWTRMLSFPMEDYPLWLSLARKGRVHFIAEACVRYRVIHGSVSRPDALERKLAFLHACRDVALFFCAAEPSTRRLASLINARHDTDVVRLLLAEKRPQEARAFMKTIPISRLLRSARLLRHRLQLL